MKKIFLKKNSKKIKIILKTENSKDYLKNKILTVEGPLGSIDYIFKNQPTYKNKKLFIPTKELSFFLNKINKLIKSVTSG